MFLLKVVSAYLRKILQQDSEQESDSLFSKLLPRLLCFRFLEQEKNASNESKAEAGRGNMQNNLNQNETLSCSLSCLE